MFTITQLLVTDQSYDHNDDAYKEYKQGYPVHTMH